MKKWGLLVTLLYAVIVIGLLGPAFVFLAAGSTPNARTFREFYQEWGFWIVAGVFILSQFALLTLSVDTTPRPLRSRTPIAITAAITGLFLMLITVVAVAASMLAVIGENKFPDIGGWGVLIGIIVGLWALWGVLFYMVYRDSEDPFTRALKWLFRGSVLELLVAVPTHVIVRRRDDCCAPLVTGFGITSGIAIMLIAFGPSVLLLFKKRMEKYERQGAEIRG